MTTPPPRERLDFLDVVRGAASLLILAEHGLYACVPGYIDAARAGVIIGQAGILVFFLISGFVIPMSLENGRSNASFWLRRAFRLFPVYWFSIAIAFAARAVGGPRYVYVGLSDTMTWLTNIVLLQGPLNYPNVWGVFWTLQYDLVIYAVCSVLFGLGLLGRIGWRVGLTVIGVIALIGVGRPLLTGEYESVNGFRLMLLCCTLFGVLARRYTAGRLGRGTYFGLVAGLFATLLSVWAVNHAVLPDRATGTELFRFVCVWGVAFGGFLAFVEARHLRMPRFACWLGLRSYPIYLLHPFVLMLLPTTWPVWAFMPCLLAGTLALSALVHRLVELPGIDLGRRLEKRLWTTARPAPAELRQAA